MVSVEGDLVAHNELGEMLYGEDHSKFLLVQLHAVPLRQSQHPRRKHYHASIPQLGKICPDTYGEVSHEMTRGLACVDSNSVLLLCPGK